MRIELKTKETIKKGKSANAVSFSILIESALLNLIPHVFALRYFFTFCIATGKFALRIAIISKTKSFDNVSSMLKPGNTLRWLRSESVFGYLPNLGISISVSSK
jgi:hypothetical protein